MRFWFAVNNNGLICPVTFNFRLSQSSSLILLFDETMFFFNAIIWHWSTQILLETVQQQDIKTWTCEPSLFWMTYLLKFTREECIISTLNKCSMAFNRDKSTRISNSFEVISSIFLSGNKPRMSQKNVGAFSGFTQLWRL